MDCHEKEFGCLCKNVGGHFPCLFHGIYVNNCKKLYIQITIDKEFAIFNLGIKSKMKKGCQFNN